MRRMRAIAAVLAVLGVVLTGCGGDSGTTADQTDPGIANPASVYCEEQGGTVEIETAGDGSQSGTCVLEDGTRVDEWEYYRQHNPDAPSS